MLSFKNTNILFAVILSVLLIIDYSRVVHWSVYIFFILVFLAIQFYGCYFINSGFHIRAFCNKQTTEREIAITFDDGPDKIITPGILDILKEFNVQAAFFCIGKKMEGNENILQRMNNERHIIGNHSFSHAFWFDLFSAQRMENELSQTENKIQSITGKPPKFFRPPYGVTNPNLKKAVENSDYQTIGWNIRSMDTVWKDPDRVLNRIKEKIKPGSVLLLHDTVANNEILLRKLLIWLRENNFKVIRIDELFNLNAYA
jgi:peptidoglycan-N-acetylglucosamine deacetylase